MRVGYQDSALFGRQLQHLGIIQAGQASSLRRLKVNAWLQAQSGFDDDLVQKSSPLRDHYPCRR